MNDILEGIHPANDNMLAELLEDDTVVAPKPTNDILEGIRPVSDNMLAELLEGDTVVAPKPTQEVSFVANGKVVTFQGRSDAERKRLRAMVRKGVYVEGFKKRRPGRKLEKEYFTDNDQPILEVAAVGMIITSKNVQLLRGCSQPAAHKALNRLVEIGYLRRLNIYGSKHIYYTLTKRGYNILFRPRDTDKRDHRSSHEPVRNKDNAYTKETLRSAERGAHARMISLYISKYMTGDAGPNPGVLALPGSDKAVAVGASGMMNERWMTKNASGGVRNENRRQAFDWALTRHRNAVGEGYDWTHMMVDEPTLWVPCGPHVGILNLSSSKFKNYHQPDLIINLESFRTSAKPVSVALEMELTVKQPAELKKILRTYCYGGRFVYGQVRYVCADRKVMKEVRKALDAVYEDFKKASENTNSSLRQRRTAAECAVFCRRAFTLERLTNEFGKEMSYMEATF